MGVSAIPPERPLIIWHPMDTPPPGYIKANGAVVSREAYAWLFSKIGTKYGAGDGVTTFRAGPDMRGEFQRGWDDGRGVDPGRVNGSGQGDAFRSHNHGVNDPGHSHGSPRGGPNNGSGAHADSALLSYISTQASLTGISIQAAGGSETRPRNVAGLFCVAIAP